MNEEFDISLPRDNYVLQLIKLYDPDEEERIDILAKLCGKTMPSNTIKQVFKLLPGAYKYCSETIIEGNPENQDKVNTAITILAKLILIMKAESMMFCLQNTTKLIWLIKGEDESNVDIINHHGLRIIFNILSKHYSNMPAIRNRIAIPSFTDILQFFYICKGSVSYEELFKSLLNAFEINFNDAFAITDDDEIDQLLDIMASAYMTQENTRIIILEIMQIFCNQTVDITFSLSSYNTWQIALDFILEEGIQFYDLDCESFQNKEIIVRIIESLGPEKIFESDESPNDSKWKQVYIEYIQKNEEVKDMDN